MSRPGKGNKAPIFSCSPLRSARPSLGPGRLQVSLFSPTSRFSAQLSEPPPPAKRRRVGLEGEGDGGARRKSLGGPGTPGGARPCLSLESSRPPRVTPGWSTPPGPGSCRVRALGTVFCPVTKRAACLAPASPSHSRHSPVCQPARKS